MVFGIRLWKWTARLAISGVLLRGWWVLRSAAFLRNPKNPELDFASMCKKPQIGSEEKGDWEKRDQVCVIVTLLSAMWLSVLSHRPPGSSCWVVNLHRQTAAVPLLWCGGKMSVVVLTTGCTKNPSISELSFWYSCHEYWFQSKLPSLQNAQKDTPWSL